MIEGRKADYLRWKGLQVYEKPLQELWKSPESASTSNEVSSEGADRQAALTTDENETHNDHVTIRKEDVVYLTADSKNTLSTLDEGKTYIIGGIVDHNKYPVGIHVMLLIRGCRLMVLVDAQKLCLGIAQEHGIAHAALPIGEYVQMATRKVLTVNQCFEIMSKWYDLLYDKGRT